MMPLMSDITGLANPLSLPRFLLRLLLLPLLPLLPLLLLLLLLLSSMLCSGAMICAVQASRLWWV